MLFFHFSFIFFFFKILKKKKSNCSLCPGPLPLSCSWFPSATSSWFLYGAHFPRAPPFLHWQSRPLLPPHAAFPRLFLVSRPLSPTPLEFWPQRSPRRRHCPVHPPRPVTSLPQDSSSSSRVGFTFHPGLTSWLEWLSMKLSSPHVLPLYTCPTPPPPLPHPHLTPFPAPLLNNRLRHSPHQSTLLSRRHVTLSLEDRLGLVWAKPSAAQNRFPRQAPRDIVPDLPPPLPSDHHSLATMPSPLTPSQTLAPVMANIPSLTLTGPFLTLHLHAPRNVLPPPRVALPMAQYMAAGQAPNWSLPSTPYSVGTTICYVCLDQDFIDKSRHCGMVTDWQLIFGTLGKGASHFAQLLSNAQGVSSHSEPQPPRSPVLSESPPISGSDLPGQAKSPISCISESLLGVLPLFPRLRASAVFALHCFVRCFGCLLLGFAGSFFSSLLGRMVEWLPSGRDPRYGKPPVSCSSPQ